VRKIQIKSKNEAVEAEILDLNSLDSIKNFADRIRKKCKRLDILVNNAGEILRCFDSSFNIKTKFRPYKNKDLLVVNIKRLKMASKCNSVSIIWATFI
jgi:NAD(P)-dependent dehydrogenase (short-subunit alcohol dehydrogenase family)